MAEVKQVEGYSNGFSFDEFKKKETVYVFYSDAPANEEVLTEGKIVELVKAKNATGRDVIRQISIDFGHMTHQVSGFRQIKERIYRKDKMEAAPAVPEKKETAQPEIIRESGNESMWVERAMGPKNKQVQKYVSEGWVFVKKIWDGEKNMYLSLLERSYQ